MDQLIKSVLSIGARLSPNNGACRIIDHFTLTIYTLTIAFHVTLLEVCREVYEILVVWQNRVSLSTKEVAVPDTKQAHNDRNIIFEWCCTKMLVYRVGAT